MSAYARPGAFPELWRNKGSRSSRQVYGRRDPYRRSLLERPYRPLYQVPSPLEEEIERAVREAKRPYRPLCSGDCYYR